ncbi:MAG: hypothetical protein PVG27_07540 [Chloroflexota bacterium]
MSDDPFSDLLPGIRVGIDMDGVLADFDTVWMTRYHDEFGAALEASMVQQWDGLHTLTHVGSMAEFWGWAQGDGRSTVRDAPALPGAIEAVTRIGRRHHLVIVSSKFDWAIPDSLAWLTDHRVPARESTSCGTRPWPTATSNSTTCRTSCGSSRPGCRGPSSAAWCTSGTNRSTGSSTSFRGRSSSGWFERVAAERESSPVK